MSGPTWTRVVKKIAVVLASDPGPRGGTRNFNLGLWKICHSAWMCMSLCFVHVFKGKLECLSRSLCCFPLFYYKLIRREFSLYTFTVMLSGFVYPQTLHILEFPQCFFFFTVQFSLPLGCHYFITFQLFLSLPSFLMSRLSSRVFLEMYVFFCLLYSLFHGKYVKWETGSTIETERMNFQETGCSPLELSFLVFVIEKFHVALFVKVLQIFVLCLCDNLVICKH